jgi:hypothetical protein
MNPSKLLLAPALCLLLSACGGTGGVTPGSPTDVSVAPGTTAGTALVSFSAPASSGDSAITAYIVTASPGGITATGTASPIAMTGLAPRTAYTYGVVATNGQGSSAPAMTGLLKFYSVVETFHEPRTQPNDTIFTGTFTFDSTSKAVSNLTGTLTQSMTKNGGVFGPPMTTVTLANQRSSVAATLGGVSGLLVTTFKLQDTRTLDPAPGAVDPTGFAPGGTQYYGLAAGTPNPMNAYAMIFVNVADPAATIEQLQIDKLAYADCTSGGMMMMSCMTGTTVAGYGRTGTMAGEPVSQVVTER